MKNRILIFVALVSIASVAMADVNLAEHRGLAEKIAKGELGGPEQDVSKGTGGISLIDSSGLEFFINTDITYSTDESASAAASDASYTTSITVSTSMGGTSMATPDDAFDGYNGLIVNGTVYIDNGSPTFSAACGNRELIFNNQTIGGLQVYRRAFVPDNDEFMRWLEVVTNISTNAVDVTISKANNLGSDSDTVVDQTSSGDSTAGPNDLWVSSYEDYDGQRDPRLGHVFFGAGGAVGLASLTFVDGDDTPAWTYETFSLAPGETAIIASFVTGQPNRTDAATQAARLATLPATAVQCIDTADRDLIINFVAPQGPTGAGIPALGGWGILGLIVLLAAAGVILTRFLR